MRKYRSSRFVKVSVGVFLAVLVAPVNAIAQTPSSPSKVRSGPQFAPVPAAEKMQPKPKAPELRRLPVNNGTSAAPTITNAQRAGLVRQLQQGNIKLKQLARENRRALERLRHKDRAATQKDSIDAIEATMQDLDRYVSKLDDYLATMGDDAQLANIDLQNAAQKMQQMIQMMSNVSKMIHDTSMSTIRKIGSNSFFRTLNYPFASEYDGITVPIATRSRASEPPLRS